MTRTALDLPPLLTGVPLAAGADVAAAAVAAADSAEPGSVFYATDDDHFSAALLLAPDRALEQAIGVAFVPLLGLNDALGALVPPEVAVHLEWPCGVRVNGARAGQLRALSTTRDPETEPDWLVLHLGVTIREDGSADPGFDTDVTSLAAEGCGDLIVADLIETWARHTMTWLHVYMTDGFADVARATLAIAHKRGDTVETPEPGTFLGLDDAGGMILKSGEATRALPLWQMVEIP